MKQRSVLHFFQTASAPDSWKWPGLLRAPRIVERRSRFSPGFPIPEVQKLQADLAEEKGKVKDLQVQLSSMLAQRKADVAELETARLQLEAALALFYKFKVFVMVTSSWVGRLLLAKRRSKTVR